MLLQESKTELLRKSRKSWFLDILAAARLCSAATKVRGHFCVKRCSPSHRRARSVSAVLENFDRHPKTTFSTLSPDKQTFSPRVGMLQRCNNRSEKRTELSRSNRAGRRHQSSIAPILNAPKSSALNGSVLAKLSRRKVVRYRQRTSLVGLQGNLLG